MIRSTTNSINTPQISPRFDINEEISSISTNLCRFSAIQDYLNSRKKTETEKLNEIKSALTVAQTLISHQTTEEESKKLLQELDKLLPGFLDSYKATHRPIKPDELPSRDFFKALYKDLEAAKISYCSISAFGLNGPTLIVNLLRDNGGPPEKWTKRFVVKWTPQSEFESTIAFRELLLATNNPLCRVPPACFLDLKEKQSIDVTGTVQPISPERFKKIRDNFSKIGTYNNCSPSNENSIMLSRKIQGANLHDFILNRYTMLNRAQKESFFEQLGFLSFFDATVGNLDRLVQISRDFEGFVTGVSAPSNLGNVMVRMPKDENSNPTIHAIDNEIHRQALNETNYKSFVEKFREKRFKDAILARNVTNSIKGSFTLTGSPFYRDLSEKNPSDHSLSDSPDHSLSDSADCSLSDTFVGKLLSGDTPENIKKSTPNENIRIFLQEMDDFGNKNISKGARNAENALRAIDLNSNLPQNQSLSARLLRERIQIFKQES